MAGLCFHLIYGIILPIDVHMFQDGYKPTSQIKFNLPLSNQSELKNVLGTAC